MSSILPGFEYRIFISCRQKDNIGIGRVFSVPLINEITFTKYQNLPKMKNTLLYILLAVFSALPVSAQVFKPVIEYSDCILEDCQSLKDDPRIQFGFLKVPENHENPDGRLLKLAFVLIKSANANPQTDPIIHLTGGPGSKALLSARINAFKNHPFSQNRDIILMDYRGIGFSEPAFCPEFQEELFQIIAENLTPAEATEKTLRQLSDRFKKLMADGINLNKYNSAAVVKDLEMLRIALGIEHWNLWGISYGTRVAQTYMRDFPGSIRCVILDSPVPMGFPDWGDEVVKYQRSLKAFFDACIENPACNNAFPDLEERFYNAMNSLKDKPLSVDYIKGPDGFGYINFQDMHLIVQQLLYDPGFYPILPWLIKGIEERNTEIFKNLLPKFEDNIHGTSDVMFVTVVKYDNGLILSDFHTEPDDPLHDALNYFDSENLMVKKINFISQDSLETRAVVSEIPSIIMVGSVDPITPPVNATLLKQSLPNSFLFEFPGRGHALTRNTECAKSIALNFLNDPLAAPGSDCIEKMEANPINWVTKMYYNPRVATMGQQMLMERRWYLLGGIAVLVLSFIISIVSALINLFKKTSDKSNPRLRIRNIVTRITALLTLLLFSGLIWLIVKTGNNHGSLVLVGLVNEARAVVFLSFFYSCRHTFFMVLYHQGPKILLFRRKDIIPVSLCFAIVVQRFDNSFSVVSLEMPVRMQPLMPAGSDTST